MANACCGTLKPTTRREKVLWVIGQMSEILSSTKLPSKKEVMALFFYYKEASKQNAREVSHSTTNEVWAKACIPTRLKKRAAEKVESLFHEYDKPKKNKENKVKHSESLLKKEEEWKDGLKSLFDIAHVDAMKKIRPGGQGVPVSSA